MTTLVFIESVVVDKAKGDQPSNTSNTNAMNKDIFGTERGGCQESVCRGFCLSYKLPPQGNRCDFCGHYPVVHEVVAGPRKECEGQEPENAQNAELNGLVTSEIVLDLDEIPIFVDDSPQNLMETEVEQIFQGGPSTQVSNLVAANSDPQSRDVDNTTPDGERAGLTHGNTSYSGVKRALVQTFFNSEMHNGSSSPKPSCSCSTASNEESPQVPEKRFKSITPLNVRVRKAISTSTPPSSTSGIPAFVSQMPRSHQYQLCVPFSLPDFIRRSAAQGIVLTPDERQLVLRWMVYTMVNLHLTSDIDFMEVAALAMQKHPTLGSSICKGVDGLVSSMKTIRRNQAYYQSRRAKQQNEISFDESETDHIAAQIQEEMASTSPSFETVKALLSACRLERKKRAQKQDCATHLKIFPCLQIPELLFWEFQKQEGIENSKDDFKMMWLKLLPRMIQYFFRNKDTMSVNLSPDQSTLELLKRMTTPSFFSQKRPSNNRKSKIIEIFKENTPIHQTLPDREDPPRLIVIGDFLKNNLSASIYVDGHTMFTGSLVEALVHLVALYWVFNVEAAADVRATLAFLGGIFLQHKANKEFKKYKSVIKALESLTVQLIEK